MIKSLLSAAALCLSLAACSTPAPAPARPGDVAGLAQAIRALSPAVDAGEAQRAAKLSYSTTYRLAQEYEITDPPLIHNAKVNAGKKPRGLCRHWAEDMQTALEREGFETIEIARAIANGNSRFLIEHSTAVIVAKGAPMESGIVIDPWREGGTLFWSPVATDDRYPWRPRLDVLSDRGQVRYADGATVTD